MEYPIRILNVVGRMGAGGIETLIMNIYRNIDRNVVQFDFLTHKGSGGIYEDEIRSLGGKIYEMPVLKRGGKTNYFKIFSYRKALKSFFKEHPEYKIIHGHMTNTATIYMPIAKKYGKVEVCIAHSHQSEKTPGLSGVVTNILQKRLPKVATDYFACSEKAAEWIYPKSYIEEGKVHVLKNGVDVNKFTFNPEVRKAVRDELGINDKYVVGNVARFKEQKNHTFLVEIFKAFHDIVPDSVLLLVGDGELRKDIEEKTTKLGIRDSVRFMGIRNDVYELMQGMDMFLLPSLFEGLPVAGVEAQATGLPMITSTEVTTESDITGNCKFIPLSSSPAEWAEEMVQFKNTFIRKDMTEYINENGFNIINTANWLTDFYIKRWENDHSDIT